MDQYMNQNMIIETIPVNSDKELLYAHNETYFTNVKVSKLIRSNPYKLAFIEYYDKKKISKPFILECNNIAINNYGVQKYGDVINKSIKIPLDSNNINSMALLINLEMADKYFESEKIKKKFIGNFYKKYKYTPCVRSGKYGKYCKMNFVLEHYNYRKRTRSNKTIFISSDNGENKRTFLNTMEDVSEFIPFGSTVNFVFQYSSIWADKEPYNGQNIKSYGVICKILSINVTKPLILLPSLLINDKATIKKAYKKYMDQMKKSIRKCPIISI